MTPGTDTDLRTLQRRLAEAEETIEALISGQVDAVVDPRASTPMLLAKAQKALRESEVRYHEERDRAQRYLDTAAVVLLALDVEGRVTLVNRHACTVLGWSSDELIGLDWIDTCVPARFREEVRGRLQRPPLDGVTVAENPILTRGGEERLMQWHNSILRDADGQVTGILSSAIDITDHTRVLDELRATEERIQFVLASADIGIWDWDPVRDVVEWSPVLYAQYGLAPGSFGGSFAAFLALVHPEDRVGVQASIARATATGSDFVVEHRTVRPDGAVRWLHGAGRVILDSAGSTIHAVGISQDITERRSLERQFQQSQKMEAVGRLASGVAHDFNNMLSVILGWSNLAVEDMPKDAPGRDAFEEVIKAGNTAAALTKQLLAFSRQQLVDPTVFDPNKLVLELDRMLQRLIGENIVLVTRTDPAAGTVRMDRSQLENVLMNLVVNARDAMPQGGQLTVETAGVVVGSRRPGHLAAVDPGAYVLLSVSDDGTGMSEEVKARIFEPFFTTKERDRGTGLGLATVYGVIKQAGGHIEVNSEIGIGTTMNLYLPRRDDAVVKRVSGAVDSVRGDETILLTEDDAAVRRITARLLEKQGYRVVGCANAAEAIQLLETGTYKVDLLLTDVVLGPGMNGRELAARAAQLRPGLPALFISGYTEDVTIVRGLADGGVPLVQKPFTGPVLGRKVREVLNGASAEAM